MNNQRVFQVLAGIVSIGAACSPALADSSLEERIAQARSAAPAMVSDDATIVVDGEIVVEGSNGWVCMPDLMAGDGAPVCLDEVWQEMVAAVGDHL